MYSNLSILFLIYFLFFSINPGKTQVVAPFCVHNGTSEANIRAFFPSDVKVDFSHVKVSKAAAILSEYLRLPSVRGKEEASGQYFLAAGEELGLHPQELRGPNGEFNGVLSIFPLSANKPNVIFISHLDVVDAPDSSEWKYPPYAGVIAEGCVWGRGAYDNKGAGVVQLVALSEMAAIAQAEDWPVNFSVLALSGEEYFDPAGARYVSDHYLDLLNPEVFIGEGPAGVKGSVSSKPTSEVYAISVSHKSALWIKLKLEYESSGHGSIPPNHYPNKDMVTAIHNVLSIRHPVVMNQYNASLLRGLGDLEGGIKGFFMKNIHLLKPISRRIIRREPLYNSFFSNTISLTEIKNFGSSHNSIPTKVEALIDCRLLPGQSKEKFIKDLHKSLDNPAIEVIIVKETPDALPSNPSHPVYTFMEQSIKEHRPKATVFPMMMPVTIDSNFFRSKGFPAFCTVPILMTPELLSRVHANNERVPISSLDTAVEILKTFIYRTGKHHILNAGKYKQDSPTISTKPGE